MHRKEIIQKIAVANNACTYVEIGVNAGEVFFSIKAPRKLGIDPCFMFKGKDKIRKWRLVNILFRKNSEFFFRESSDDFFRTHQDLFKKKKIDVAFVDGLHTYLQTYTDISNCLSFLDENGVIVVHDCSPPTKAAETPAIHSMAEIYEKAEKGEIPGWEGKWNGDVWKSIVRLRSERDDLNITTLDTDWGVAIIFKEANNKKLSYSAEDVAHLKYEDLDGDRVGLINLKDTGYLEVILEKLKRKINCNNGKNS